MNNLFEIPELTDLASDLVRFEQQLLNFLTRFNLKLAHFPADHISVRCHKVETAMRWQAGLLKCATILSQNMINGRIIYLFDLCHSIKVASWEIDCIELPYPGQKHYPHEGWEHIELVLPGDPDTLNQRALACLSDIFLSAPETKLKQSMPQAEKEALPNPTLAISDGMVTIKFHPYSIRDIVLTENN